LIKIKEQFDDKLDEIYLLYSDTALSRIAAEKLQKTLSYYEELKDSKIKPIEITHLQIWDRDKFIKGMGNLIDTIYRISQENWKNVIINITGGYKATIPYLTLLAEINECAIYYIFEDTDALIKIPYLPIDIKWDVFERYWDSFEKIAHPESILRSDLNDNFIKTCTSLLTEEKIDNKLYVSLNPLGEILWRKYKSRFFIFYAPEEVSMEIKKQGNIRRILNDKFRKDDVRRKKTENKNGHCVYDDGDNPYRIFYFEMGKKIYIYKTFENHKEYEDYLKQVEFNSGLKDRIMRNSKIHKQEVKSD